MMIFSLVAMTGLEKCCITSAYLQWLCHSGERPVAHGPLVLRGYQLEGSLYVKLKDSMSNSMDPDEMAHYEPSHLDLRCL